MALIRPRLTDYHGILMPQAELDFAIHQCHSLGIPTQPLQVQNVYNYRKNSFETQDNVFLPTNPLDGKPLIFVPKRWLRFVPWLNYEDYFAKYCPQDEISHRPEE